MRRVVAFLGATELNPNGFRAFGRRRRPWRDLAFRWDLARLEGPGLRGKQPTLIEQEGTSGSVIMMDRDLVARSGVPRTSLALIVVLRLLVTATFVAQALLLARLVVDAVTRGGVLLPAVAIGLLMILRAVALWWGSVLEARAAADAETSLRAQLVKKLIELGPAFTTMERTGELESTVLTSTSSVGFYVGVFVPSAVSSLLAFSALVALILVIDPVVAAIVTAASSLLVLAPIASERAFGEAGARFWQSFGRLAAEYLDALQGMATLKVFDAHDRWGERLRTSSEDLSRDAVSLTGLASMYVGFVAFAIAAGTGFGAAKVAFQIAGGDLRVSTALSLLFLVRELFRPLTELQASIPTAATGLSAGGRIKELLDRKPNVRVPVPGRVPAVRVTPTIRFDRVRFTYPGQSHPALEDVTFEVGERETVAVVGRSGAGKSTLVSLLLRFHDPERGRILLGGHDVRDLPLEAVRKLVAIVPQDTYLFHRSVRDNLLLGNPEVSPGQVEAAARAAHAHDFIAELPDGYDTVVGERGIRLSGGERQRLAIARALLRDAPILVLDEATSSVDAESEALIQDAIGALTSTRTSIVIAHRLSTVRAADRIVVLDRGRVLEVGPAAELAENNGAYARLMAAQEAI